MSSRNGEKESAALRARATMAANVNVNNTLAYRKGEYYRVELNPDNSSAAV